MRRPFVVVLLATLLGLIAATAFPPTWDLDSDAAVMLDIMVPGTKRYSAAKAELMGLSNLRFAPVWSLRDSSGRDWRGRYDEELAWSHRLGGSWWAQDPAFSIWELPVRWSLWFSMLIGVPLLGGLLALALYVRENRRRMATE